MKTLMRAILKTKADLRRLSHEWSDVFRGHTPPALITPHVLTANPLFLRTEILWNSVGRPRQKSIVVLFLIARAICYNPTVPAYLTPDVGGIIF